MADDAQVGTGRLAPAAGRRGLYHGQNTRHTTKMPPRKVRLGPAASGAARSPWPLARRHDISGCGLPSGAMRQPADALRTRTYENPHDRERIVMRWFLLRHRVAGSADAGRRLAQPLLARQAWPTKPIRVIVPLTAGSASDVMARDRDRSGLGSSSASRSIVENRPGAGNTIGMSAVAKAEPDGYTLLVNSSTHTVTPATRSNLGFEMTDLAAHHPARQHAGGDGVQSVEGLQEAQRLRRLRRRPIPARSTTRRPAPAIPRISTASGSASPPASRRCTCRSRARRKR